LLSVGLVGVGQAAVLGEFDGLMVRERRSKKEGLHD
jgi:hypothetical protein